MFVGVWFVFGQAPLLGGAGGPGAGAEKMLILETGQFPQAGGAQGFHTHLGQVISTVNV